MAVIGRTPTRRGRGPFLFGLLLGAGALAGCGGQESGDQAATTEAAKKSEDFINNPFGEEGKPPTRALKGKAAKLEELAPKPPK